MKRKVPYPYPHLLIVILCHPPNPLTTCSVPSQIPVMEDTQFVQILHESFDFFNIDEKDYKNFFLTDTKSSE